MTPLAATRRLVGVVQLLVVASAATSTAQSLALNGPGGPLWWWAPSLLLALGCVVAMVVAVVRGWSPIPPAAAVALLSAAVLLSGMVLANRGLVRPPVEGAPASWVAHLGLVGVTGLAVLARRWPPGPGVVVLLGGAVLVVGWRADAAFWPPRTMGDALVDAGFVFVTTLTVHGVMRAVDQVGGQLSSARDAARDASDAQLRAGAEEADRHRWEALVHDEVLSSLAAARAAGPGPARRATADAARRALVAVRTDPPTADVTPQVLGDALVTAVRTEHPPAVLRLDIGSGGVEGAGAGPTGGGDPDRPTLPRGAAPLPAAVASAVVHAAVQAVRNTTRHAGPGAVALVTGSLRGDRVEVTVHDDGRGFDPGAVSPYRLGLRLSVLERLAGVGGCAHVDSSAGAGTRVVLHWPAAASHPPAVLLAGAAGPAGPAGGRARP